jgi:predicted MFS family arabinose efflux permease
VYWLFALDAVVAALIAVMLTALYRDTFVPKPTPHIFVMLGDALRAVIHSPVAATIFVVNFVWNTAFFFSYAYLPVRIGEVVDAAAAPVAIGVTQGAAGASTLIGSAVWGALADRVGHRRLLVFLMLGVALLWLPLFAAQGVVDLALGWAVLSIFNPSVSSLMFTIISLNVPADKRGSVLSMIYLPLNVAFIVGPLMASLVARNWEVRDVFLVSAALAFTALVIFVANVGRTRGRRAGEVVGDGLG